MVASSAETSFTATIFTHTHNHRKIKIKMHTTFGSQLHTRSGEEKKYVPTRPKKKRCVGVRGGLGGQVNVSYQNKSDRFSTPENQASRLSLIPLTPLSKGLVTDFFVLGLVQDSAIV